MKISPVKFATIVLISGSLLACSSKPKRIAEPVAQAPTPRMEIVNTERGELVTLNDVLFDFEKASLRPEANQIVEQAAAYLKKYPEKVVLIEGHTDNLGADSYNDQLSMDRSASVKQSLLQFGVDSSKIQTRAYGEAKPVASNATLDGRQANRRVEIIFKEPGTQISQR